MFVTEQPATVTGLKRVAARALICA